MAVQVRAASTVTVASGTSVNVNKPAGVQAGDLLLLAVGMISDALNLSRPPADWYLLQEGSVNGARNISVWYKVAGASEPSTYAVTNSSATFGLAMLALYSDAAAELGIADSAWQYNTSGANRTYPSVTTTVNDGYHVCMGHHGGLSSTPAGGYTEHWDTTVISSRLYCMSGALPVAGATGSISATGSAVDSKCVSVAVVETALVTACPRARDSATTGSQAVTSSISVTAPASIQASDFLLLQLTTAASRTISDPAGWTALTGVTGAGGIYGWYKIADGSEASASITVDFTGGSTTMSLAVTPFFSPRGWNVQLDAQTAAALSSGTSVVFPSVTASAANATLCLLAGRDHTTGFTPSDNSDLWRLFDTGSSSVRLSLLSELLSDAGATGTRTVEWSSGTLACNAIVLTLIEVEPVAAILRRIYPSEGYYSVVYAGVDLTEYLKIGALTGETKQLETTSLADDYPASEPGSTNWQISLGGPLTKALDDLLGKDALGPPATMRNLVITIGETGNATTYTWTGTSEVGAFVAGYRVGPNVQFAEVPFRADLAVSGAPVRGTA